MSVNNLLDYKKAKQNVPQLKKMLTSLDECISILTPFEKYNVIFKSIDDMRSLRIVLNSELIKQTAILQQKGSKK